MPNTQRGELFNAFRTGSCVAMSPDTARELGYGCTSLSAGPLATAYRSSNQEPTKHGRTSERRIPRRPDGPK